MLAPSAWSDTLQLKSGADVQGKYLGGTSNNVNFEVNGKVESYPRSQIMLIEFSSSTAAAAPAAGTAVEQKTHGLTKAASPAGATVPAGTQVEVRMVNTVNSKDDPVGTKFQATLVEPLEVNGVVAAPQGSMVYGQLINAQQSGTFAGKSELELQLTGIDVNGKRLAMVTSDYSVAGKSRGKQTATRAGVGAGLGALIGAIAGGGKGAGIGALVGGGAGAASQIITKGEQVNVPSETVLTFTLAQPLQIPAQ